MGLYTVKTMHFSSLPPLNLFPSALLSSAPPKTNSFNCLMLLGFFWLISDFGLVFIQPSVKTDSTALKADNFGKMLDWSCWYLCVKIKKNNSQAVWMFLRSNISSLLCTCWKSSWALALHCMAEHAQFLQCHAHPQTHLFCLIDQVCPCDMKFSLKWCSSFGTIWPSIHV